MRVSSEGTTPHFSRCTVDENRDAAQTDSSMRRKRNRPHPVDAAFSCNIGLLPRTGSASQAPSSFSSCLRIRRSGPPWAPSSCRPWSRSGLAELAGLDVVHLVGASAGFSAAGNDCIDRTHRLHHCVGISRCSSPDGRIHNLTRLRRFLPVRSRHLHWRLWRADRCAAARWGRWAWPWQRLPLACPH